MNYAVAVTGHSFHDISIEQEILGDIADVRETRARTGDELKATVENADAILNQSARLDRHLIQGLQRCKVIVEYGIGVDKIDVATAKERGILVCNVPDYCVEEVSTHALALLLAFERQIPALMNRLRSGHWDQPAKASMRRLRGRRLGLVGFGRIAQRLAALAGPFGMEIAAYDPLQGNAAFEKAGVRRMGLTDLLEASEYISIHCPLTAETHGLIGHAELRRMPSDAVLVNVSRGKIIQEDALVAALEGGRLRGAALDVFEEEPLDAASPLLGFDNVVLSPHVAWFSKEAEDQLKRETAEEARDVLLGGKPRSPV